MLYYPVLPVTYSRPGIRGPEGAYMHSLTSAILPIEPDGQKIGSLIDGRITQVVVRGIENGRELG